jgi:protein tyrosine/serine phosphatase
VHCVAGQDRTGALIAAPLLALGVEREIAVEDYARSAQSWTPDRVAQWIREQLGTTPPDLDSAALAELTACAHHLEGAIDRVLEKHGSIEEYWASAGVTRKQILRIRSVLTIVGASVRS